MFMDYNGKAPIASGEDILGVIQAAMAAIGKVTEKLRTKIPLEAGPESVIKEQNKILELTDYKISERTELVEFLKMFEDYSATAEYATSNEDYKTIGYGHLCDEPNGADKKYLEKNYIMSKEEAEILLIQDIKDHFPEELLKSIYAQGGNLYDYQIDALVSMSFNGISFSSKKSPKTRAYLISNVYSEQETLEHLLTYVVQKNKNGEVEVLPGLVKRRVAEAMIFSGLEYPIVESGNFYGDEAIKQMLFEYANSFGMERAPYCLE